MARRRVDGGISKPMESETTSSEGLDLVNRITIRRMGLMVFFDVVDDLIAHSCVPFSVLSCILCFVDVDENVRL